MNIRLGEKMSEQGLTIADVCRRLRIERTRVKALIDAGKLDTFVVPAAGRYQSALRVKLSSVEALESPCLAVPVRDDGFWDRP